MWIFRRVMAISVSWESAAMRHARENSGGNLPDAIDDTNAHVNFLYPACVGDFLVCVQDETNNPRPGANAPHSVSI